LYSIQSFSFRIGFFHEFYLFFVFFPLVEFQFFYLTPVLLRSGSDRERMRFLITLLAEADFSFALAQFFATSQLFSFHFLSTPSSEPLLPAFPY